MAPFDDDFRNEIRKQKGFRKFISWQEVSDYYGKKVLSKVPRRVRYEMTYWLDVNNHLIASYPDIHDNLWTGRSWVKLFND